MVYGSLDLRLGILFVHGSGWMLTSADGDT
jgi:hypothetical protein